MTKKVAIISQDYDGCFSIMTSDGLEGELNGVNKEAWETLKKEGVNVLNRIMTTRQKYNDFLTNITKEAAEVRVYVGSDRQSYALDELNNLFNKNGSVFPAIELLCKERNTKTQAWLFESLLLSDPPIIGNKPFKRDRGVAYQRIMKQSSKHLEVVDPPLYFQHSDGTCKTSKRPLLLHQMWDAYRQNPKATELEFHFIDDRPDLIKDILENLNPKAIPPKMTLVISKFDYIGDITDEPQSFCHCGTIPSFSLQKQVAKSQEVAEIKRATNLESSNSKSSFKNSFSSRLWNKFNYKTHKGSMECDREEESCPGATWRL